MKINLTNKQYKSLIQLLYLGTHMTNGIRSEDDTITDFEEVEQYIYSFYKDFHCEDLIDPADGTFYPTRDFDDLVSDYIGDYEDDSFWFELIHRLGRKKFAKQYSQQTIKQMDVKDLIAAEHPFLEEYEKEISVHGLKNIDIVK